jgi:hypothetical protein
MGVPSYPLPRQQEVRKNYDDIQACYLPAVYSCSKQAMLIQQTPPAYVRSTVLEF